MAPVIIGRAILALFRNYCAALRRIWRVDVEVMAGRTELIACQSLPVFTNLFIEIPRPSKDVMITSELLVGSGLLGHAR